MPARSRPWLARRLFRVCVVLAAAYTTQHLASHALVATEVWPHATGRSPLDRPVGGVTFQDWALLPIAAYAAVLAVETWRGRAGLVGWRLPGGHLWTRGAALLGAAFVGFHLWHLSVPRWLGRLDESDVRPTLVAALSSTAAGGVPVVAALYLLGTGAVCFHLTQSVLGLFRRSGDPPADKPALSWWGAAGLALSIAMAAIAIIALATGSPRW